MIDHGFLIVEKFEYLYEKYKVRYQLTSDRYAIPRIDRCPQDYHIQYRGIDRDCLTSNEISSRNLAEIRMFELLTQMKSGDEEVYHDDRYLEQDFVKKEILDDVYSWLEDERHKYETIFVKIADIDCEIPKAFNSIGFEPSFFYTDHFSASCDCMLFPRWHGTDEEGLLFLNYFRELNSCGLFNSIIIAKEFLEYYLSFDWTERGDFYITEVFLNENDVNKQIIG